MENMHVGFTGRRNTEILVEMVFDAGFPENNRVGKKDAERGVLVWQQILERRQISCDLGKFERCRYFFFFFSFSVDKEDNDPGFLRVSTWFHFQLSRKKKKVI